MPDSRRGRTWFPTLVAVFALLALAPQAGATGDHEYASSEKVPLGLFIDEADTNARLVKATIRCTDPYHDGKTLVFAVAEDVDMSALAAGSEVGALVDKSTEPKAIVALLENDCPAPPREAPDYPKPEPKPGGDHAETCAGASRNGEEQAESEDGCLPQFVRGFLTRVWKFIGEVDYYETGEMGMTLGKILNVPRRWRHQDDELLDQDATVLVSNRARVFENGERVSRDRLDAANDVRVHGKLLRPSQWREDEDGSPVPTIRAKKVYITG